MADGKLPLSPASPGGQIEDVEQLNVPTPTPPLPGPGLIALVRQRVQTVGRLYNQIAAVLDADPAANEFGLVTRGVDAAKETTLAAVLAQLDVALSTRASEATLTSILAGLVAALDVPLSTRASEVTAASILAQLDVALSTRAADATITARLNTLGQKPMAASAPVVIASDQSPIPVSQDSGPWETNLTEIAGVAVTTQAPGEQLVAVEGRAASGAAPVGNPNLAAGSDGAAVRNLLTDTSGRQQIVGAAAQGAAVAGNPVLVCGEDATGNVSRLQERVAQPARTDAGLVSRTLPSVIGAHANAWNAVAVLAGGVSTAIDTEFAPHVAVFGNLSGTSTITIQLSQDNVNFYDADSFNNPGGGDFGYFNTIGVRYVRLKSSAARTITATVAGKD